VASTVGGGPPVLVLLELALLELALLELALVVLPVPLPPVPEQSALQLTEAQPSTACAAASPPQLWALGSLPTQATQLVDWPHAASSAQQLASRHVPHVPVKMPWQLAPPAPPVELLAGLAPPPLPVLAPPAPELELAVVPWLFEPLQEQTSAAPASTDPMERRSFVFIHGLPSYRKCRRQRDVGWRERREDHAGHAAAKHSLIPETRRARALPKKKSRMRTPCRGTVPLPSPVRA
jgi:hypothetical protein